MTKPVTLENVLTKSQANREKHKELFQVPEADSMKMLIRYSMALQVIKTESSGSCYLILN